jgi:predicted nucleotidyltransferase
MSDERIEGAPEAKVSISIPLPDEQIFRYKAADDILELLFRNPHRKFTITELRSVTGHGGKSVDSAVQILSSLELVTTGRDGRQRLVGINQDRITKPDDPIVEIPQEAFRKPVREFLERIEKEYSDTLVGVILFGSVARGEADRASDIDIQVIVETEKLPVQRNLQKLRKEIQNKRFGGDRYKIQVMVESTDSVENYGQKLHSD